ncbi:hypothetical protein B0O99DRAFT_686711 [Bisporella sp. PMI_857]|nr:hypothetical protein B0O99DRAFT_686711 [Bisporella sp. PMI_857]
MRGVLTNLEPLDTNEPRRGLQAPLNPEGDSQSSSSNSPSPIRPDPDESDFYNVNNDSQSSIGNTFQDMAVSEELKSAPAARLPAEVLIAIFSKLSNPHDQMNCMRVSKLWANTCVELLWHRPACTTWEKHEKICNTLSLDHPYFAYREFIKRLNLASLAKDVNDGSVEPLAVCPRVERLTLTNCKNITDSGLIALLDQSVNLLALDIAGNEEITEASMKTLARFCHKLQGLNITGCQKISNESLIEVANNCKYIKRLKLNDCSQLEDGAILAFANNCQNILEIDLHQCRNVGNDPVTALLLNGLCLRELRLANCELISDSAFLNLPLNKTYEHLRILDLTSCSRLTDRAVEKIIDVAPRLRNLVFAKCRNLTDFAVIAISKLGKNLHYLHLGHCGNITDIAVKQLVKSCNRIRYIDLGCCIHLTDDSIEQLATLPKLRRIGLVKCSNITDRSVKALAISGASRTRQVTRQGGYIHNGYTSSLERVHLSYCTNLTLSSILLLLNSCQKLTHLSLTGVQAFLRPDFERFCREAPPEFTEHQRNVFCVFSGDGVTGLRNHLNEGNPPSPGFDDEHNHLDDQTMTGMIGGAALTGEDDDADEELDGDENAVET